MNSLSIYRLGGLAAIVGILLSFGAYAANIFLSIGVLVLVVYIVALYRWFSALAPGLSLAVLVAGIAGAILVAVTVLVTNSQVGALVTLGSWAGFFLPPLVFGFLAYQHRSAGLPRALAVCGLVAGVFGLINSALVIIGGGDYANPTYPALAPFINVTYFAAIVPTLLWIVWSGIWLLRAGAAPLRQPA